MTENFCYEDFIKFVHVPRETFSHLENYVNLLKKWQSKINLISNSTISDIWKRHIVDSAQLIEYLSKSDKVIDLGSGGGFPGIVLSILGIKDMTLVESDSRKAEFLKEAARTVGIKINVICQRVEKVALDGFAIVTARGFASLKDIFQMLAPTLTKEHKLLLLKGKSFKEEISAAEVDWSFDYKHFPSVTDKAGVVALIENASKRRPSKGG
jgi:16S rRNA (guanine527-N7)-methyltransferase